MTHLVLALVLVLVEETAVQLAFCKLLHVVSTRKKFKVLFIVFRRALKH